MTPPKMPENNEGIAQDIAYSFILTKPKGYSEWFNKNNEEMLSDIHARAKAALDTKDLLHKDQLEAGKKLADAVENALEEDIDRMATPNRTIYGFSSSEEKAIKVKEALLALRKAGCL